MTTVDANIARAAKTLSMRPTDITSADEAPAGFVIGTADGVSYIDVPADHPDADGKTGLMFLVKPNPERTYTFPVYAPHEDEQPVDEPPADEPAGDADSITAPPAPEPPPRSGKGSGEKAWRAWVAAHPDADLVDLDGAESRDDVIAAAEDAGLIDRETNDG